LRPDGTDSGGSDLRRSKIGVEFTPAIVDAVMGVGLATVIGMDDGGVNGPHVGRDARARPRAPLIRPRSTRILKNPDVP